MIPFPQELSTCAATKRLFLRFLLEIDSISKYTTDLFVYTTTTNDRTIQELRSNRNECVLNAARLLLSLSYSRNEETIEMRYVYTPLSDMTREHIISVHSTEN